MIREEKTLTNLSINELNEVEDKLRAGKVYAIATGDQDGEMRLYLYTRYVKFYLIIKNQELLCFSEMSIIKADGQGTISSKSSNMEFAASINEYLAYVLKN